MNYGLLGEKLGHSYSPEIHALLGIENYQLFEVAKDNLETFLKDGDFKGLNVTIPYKKSVMPYLDEISDRAKEIGSVNVIVKRDDGTLYGDNADSYGFYSLVRKSGISVKDKKVLVLGSGGASVCCEYVLKSMHAKEVVVISRSGENNYENIANHADADVIVNTTPVGMYPNNGISPISLDVFTNLSGVIDIIYNPVKTSLVLDAESRGIPAVGGIHMLVMQALKTEEIFLDAHISRKVADRAEEIILKQKKNITIIGMPGSGKTVIGRRLAIKTGREFVDIDQLIEKEEGKSINQIFAEGGEELFRQIETRYTAEVSKRSGLVISTGGGVVTRPENKPLLKQNSTVVYLICNNPGLSTKKRPVSAAHSYEELAKVRIPLYKSWSDISILNTGISETASALMRLMNIKSAPRESKDNNEV